MINRLHMAMIDLYSGDSKRIQHFCKVHSYAKLIAENENVDDKTLFIIEAAALTHDIGIHTCEKKYGNCGRHLVYELCIPKADTHKLEGCAVEFFGKRWRVLNGVQQYITQLTPLDWDKKVQVERYE